MRWIAFLNVTKAINKDTKTFLLNFQQGVILKTLKMYLLAENFALYYYTWQSIQVWTKYKLCEIAFKKPEAIYHFKIFKGCLPQILLGSFLVTLLLYILCIFSNFFFSYLQLTSVRLDNVRTVVNSRWLFSSNAPS